MKFTAVLLLAGCLQLSARSVAQITLSVKNAPIEKVLKEIKRQSGLAVVYPDALLLHALPVSVAVRDAPLDEALKRVFADQPFTYEIIAGKIISIKERETPVKMVLEEAATPPPMNIHGRVTDSLGNPLAGASVTVKGSKRGTQTNQDGVFIIMEVDPNAILVVSFTGYETKEVKLNGKTDMYVQLKHVAASLQDVVINKGYYTTTQRLNTGDVTKVTSADIEKQPVSNVLQALQGRVPGLVITQQSGIPGTGFKVQIRGQNSIGNGTDPFYVVDGVPYNSQMPFGSTVNSMINGTLHGGNPLNYINPYDIESVEVLKDADATAIYGSRAANGAILITTKKGKAGVMRPEASLTYGVTEPAHHLPLMNREQYLTMRREAFKNDGMLPKPTDYDINGTWDTTRYTDWYKVLSHNPASYLNATTTISGGNANTQYLLSTDYYRQSTPFPKLLPGDGLDQRASVHFNVSASSPDNKFKAVMSGSYAADKNTVQPIDFTSASYAPDAPALFNPDGSLNWAPLVPGQAGTWNNPLSNLYNKYHNSTSNLVSNLTLTYNILHGLQANVNLGYTNLQTNAIQTNPIAANDPGRNVTSGRAQFGESNGHTWIIEPQLNYNIRVGKGTFSASLGSTFSSTNSSAQALNATGFVSDALLQNVQAATSVTITSNSAQYRYDAMYALLNYNWEDKYILNITGRRDGSSRFGPSNQFANFGSVAGAWIFTREKWAEEHLSFLSFGKLRASYGITGTQPSTDYQYLNLYTVTYNPYNGTKGSYPTSLFNPDLAWEVTRKLEGGIEIGLLEDRINVQASYYRNRSNNELLSMPLSMVTGFSSIPSNLPALVQNKGLEIMINTVNIRTRDFSWTSSFNISRNRNKLVSFPNLANTSYASQFIIGQPLNIMRLFRYLGVNKETGVYQLADAKGNPTYSPAYNVDNNILMDMTPGFFGGLDNKLQYKHFTLDFLFQFFQQKAENVVGIYSGNPGIMNNEPTLYLDRWRKPGDVTRYEMFSQSGANESYYVTNYVSSSGLAYGDGSYARLKSLMLQYELPDKLKQKAHLKHFQVYMEGENLLTITPYFGYDPESQSNYMPPARVWTFGLRMGL